MTKETVNKALQSLQVKTPGVQVGADIRIGKDSTGDDAVWVYVAVPEERMDSFYQEWTDLRFSIRKKVQELFQKPEMFVYVRMLGA